MRRPLELSAPFRKRLAAFTGDLGRLYEVDPEAVHRTRVSSRRLREILPLMPLPGSTKRNLGKRLRRVTRRLGRVRELDVLWLTTREFSKDPHNRQAVEAVGLAVEEARGAARARFAAKVPLAAMKR